MRGTGPTATNLVENRMSLLKSNEAAGSVVSPRIHRWCVYTCEQNERTTVHRQRDERTGR